MKNGSKRRLSLVVLAVCMGLIVVIGLQMWKAVWHGRGVVRYGAAVVQPVTPELCPGEGLQYMQSLHVTTTGMVDISRDWCNRGGVCSLDLHQHWDGVVLTPLDFTGPVTRTVPVSPLFKPGGLYELRSGVQNGQLSVQIVPFKIRNDCLP